MENFNLNAMGVKEMDSKEMKHTNGGILGFLIVVGGCLLLGGCININSNNGNGNGNNNGNTED